MVKEIAILIANLIITILIPIIIWVVLIAKNKNERKGIIILFILGALFYAGLQWGLKQHGLAYLFNHTDFESFMNNHYIPYLGVVALAGAILSVIPEWITIHFVYKKKVTFKQAIALGLGYVISESAFLMGYQSVMSIIQYYKNSDMEFSTSAGELMLSGYERILLSVIGIALIVVLVYFIEQKMPVRGIIIKTLVQAVIAFLPGFFIAFSTKNYLEVFDRSTTLIMVYVVLTTACVTGVAVLNGLKWKLYD